MKLLIYFFIILQSFYAFSAEKDDLLFKGIDFFQKQNFEESIKQFEKLIDLYPRSGEAYFYLGNIFTRQEEYKKAELNFIKALQIDPKWSAAYESLGNVYFKQGDLDKAVSTYKSALKYNPDSPEALKFFGDNFYSVGNFSQAKKIYLKLKEIEPNNPEISKKLGFVFLREENLEQSLKYFSVYSGLYPFDIDVSNRVFLMKFIKNQQNPPELIAQAKIDLFKQDLSSQDIKGNYFFEKKEIKEQQIIKEEQEKEKNKIKVTTNIFLSIAGSLLLIVTGILIYLIKKNKKENFVSDVNKKSYEKITKKELKEAVEIKDMKILLEKAKKIGDIEAERNLSLKLAEKGDVEVSIDTARDLELEGKNTEAIEILNKIKDKCDKEYLSNIYIDLIRIMLKLDMTDKARDIFAKLKELKEINLNIFMRDVDNYPNSFFEDAELFRIITDFFIDNGKTGKAKALIEKFINISEDADAVLALQMKLVRILKEQNLNREAVSMLSDLIEKRPEKIEYYFKIVEGLLLLKDYKNCTKYINTVIRSFPDKTNEFISNIMDNIDKYSANRNFFELMNNCLNHEHLRKYNDIFFQKYIEKFKDEKAYSEYYDFLRMFREEKALELIEVFIKEKWKSKIDLFLKDLNDYLRKNPEDYKKIFTMAKMLLLSGRDSEAYILFKKIYDTNKDISALKYLFDISVALKREDDIILNAQNLIKNNEYMSEITNNLEKIETDNKAIMYLYIDVLDKNSEIDKAVEKLRYYEIKFPDDINLKKKFADILFKKNPKEALDKYKTIIKIEPDNAENWFNTGKVFQTLNDIDSARKSYLKSISTGLENDNCFNTIVNFLKQNGFFDEALLQIEKIKDFGIKNTVKEEVIKEKARFEFKLIKKLISKEIIPENSQHIIDGKNINVLKTDFLKSIENIKDQNILKRYLAEQLLKMQAYDEGINLIQELLKTDDNSELHFILGKLFAAKSLPEIAYKEYIKITWFDDIENSNEKLYYLGNYFEEQGLEKEALHFYREIFARDVNYKDVNSKLERLDSNILLSRTIDESTGLTLEIRKRYDEFIEIGKGGMGIVYKALDKKLGRKVALKVMNSEFVNNKDAVDRFLTEARAIASLNHPNIIGIFDVNSGKNVYYAMEYVKGTDLRQILLSKKKLPTIQVFSYGEKICTALEYIHNNNIVHRDIKPENIMIDTTNNVKLMDFGLACEENIVVNDVMGTPFYMSPEQIKGGKIDRRTDIYSLGVTFYHLLTGVIPFDGDDIKNKHLNEEPLSPSAHNSEISLDVDKIILKCMKKSPDERYNNMTELKNSIKEILY
ncbi:MAG: protein kinase [Candidatus Muirbacterium halophilum]|nr:protein kinase [Candidatus Muirbacterium halophilum]MCK9475744.1 protein kinase [Candidatus Muirbacterium halophilum]